MRWRLWRFQVPSSGVYLLVFTRRSGTICKAVNCKYRRDVECAEEPLRWAVAKDLLDLAPNLAAVSKTLEIPKIARSQIKDDVNHGCGCQIRMREIAGTRLRRNSVY